MVIWLYCFFGNEAKLMPYFIRHYAPIVDRMIMLDSGSTDGSADILRAIPNVTVEKSKLGDSIDSIPASSYLSEKCKEARGKADYVIVVDFDEFLYSSAPLRELIAYYKQRHGIKAIKAQGYQMVNDLFPELDAPLTELVRLGVRDREYDKMAIFDPVLDVRWSPGRHNYSFADRTVAIKSYIKLLHYRYLGEEYFVSRNAHNQARRSEAEIASGRGYQVSPDYVKGKYSLAWFKQMRLVATDVISDDDE